MRFSKLLCLPLLLCYFVSLNLSAQVGNPAKAGDKSLEIQFEEMVDESNRYQKFRVVPYEWLMSFQGNLKDTVAADLKMVSELQSEISDQAATIKNQELVITEKEEEVTTLTGEKDGISLLGTQMSKATYSAILWGIIGILLAAMLFFMARGRYAVTSSNSLEAANRELTDELDQSRKQRLKVEQDLRRKLQDEINRRG
jgi:beta-lactamase regulating signal transducer with metallopeptidase domain